jgi:hypothetical protein
VVEIAQDGTSERNINTCDYILSPNYGSTEKQVAEILDVSANEPDTLLAL